MWMLHLIRTVEQLASYLEADFNFPREDLTFDQKECRFCMHQEILEQKQHQCKKMHWDFQLMVREYCGNGEEYLWTNHSLLKEENYFFYFILQTIWADHYVEMIIPWHELHHSCEYQFNMPFNMSRATNNNRLDWELDCSKNQHNELWNIKWEQLH